MGAQTTFGGEHPIRMGCFDPGSTTPPLRTSPSPTFEPDWLAVGRLQAAEARQPDHLGHYLGNQTLRHGALFATIEVDRRVLQDY